MHPKRKSLALRAEKARTALDEGFRRQQLVYSISSVITGLLLTRFVLFLFGVNPESYTAYLLKLLTDPLVTIFDGVIKPLHYDSSYIEVGSLVASIVYLSLGWGIIEYLRRHSSKNNS